MSPRSSVAMGFPDEADVATMFGGDSLSALVVLSDRVCGALGGLLEAWGPGSAVGGIMLELAASSGLFLDFASRTPGAISCMARCGREYPMLGQLLTQLKALPAAGDAAGSGVDLRS
jgi:hypothetical protein